MAQIPDTPAIANALNANDPAQAAARTRLLLLHQLGATMAGVKARLREQIATLTAERDARPTAEAYDELLAARNALQAQVDELTAPPPVFSVPIVPFRAGLIPMRLRLLSTPDAIKAKWDVVLRELMILTAVYPREEPVASLLEEAVLDGVMTEAEKTALRGE